MVTLALRNVLSDLGMRATGFNERFQSPEGALEDLAKGCPDEFPGFKCVGHLTLMSLKGRQGFLQLGGREHERGGGDNEKV